MILFLLLEKLGKMERDCPSPRREGGRVLNVDAFASVTDSVLSWDLRSRLQSTHPRKELHTQTATDPQRLGLGVGRRGFPTYGKGWGPGHSVEGPGGSGGDGPRVSPNSFIWTTLVTGNHSQCYPWSWEVWTKLVQASLPSGMFC